MVSVMFGLTVAVSIVALLGFAFCLVDMIETFSKEPFQMNGEIKVRIVKNNIAWMGFFLISLAFLIMTAVALGSKPETQTLWVPTVTKVCPEAGK